MAKNQEMIILEYKDILNKIENEEAHLLLGNGFNRGLGVNTSYKAIFWKMLEDNKWVYKDALPLVIECKYDLELFIWKLQDDVHDKNPFLIKYISNKVKLDFMKAAHDIVKTEIKNVYAEKNQGIYMLFKNFSNYFTLNYDSFLYLLLLNFKTNDNNQNETTISIQPSINFIEQELNETQNNIYADIKEARENWSFNIAIHEDIVWSDMHNLTKSNFWTFVEIYGKKLNKGWKKIDIDKAINILWEEEKGNKKLSHIDDWIKVMKLFWGEREYIFDIEKETQNLFFLHGAFHIYVDENSSKKITQKDNKALYNRLEEILNNEEEEILCIFQSENKLDEINKNEYLIKSYNKLSEITGVMVIIWSSLSKNDQHVFDQINSSWIHTLYISSREESLEKNHGKSMKLFPGKNIIMFQTESISYELPNMEENDI